MMMIGRLAVVVAVVALAAAVPATRPSALDDHLHLYRYTQPVQAPGPDDQEAVLTAIKHFNDEGIDEDSHYVVYHPVKCISFAYYHQVRRELAVAEGDLLPIPQGMGAADVVEGEGTSSKRSALVNVHDFLEKALDILVHKAESYWKKWLAAGLKPIRNRSLMSWMKRWMFLTSTMSTILYCFRWIVLQPEHHHKLEGITMFQSLFMMTSFHQLYSRVDSSYGRLNLTEAFVWIFLYEQLVLCNFDLDGHPVGQALKMQCAIIQPNMNLHSSPEYPCSMLSRMDTIWRLLCDHPSKYPMPQLQPVDPAFVVEAQQGAEPLPHTVGVEPDQVHVPSRDVVIDLPGITSACATKGMQHEPNLPEGRLLDTVDCLFCHETCDANYAQVRSSQEAVRIAPSFFQRCGRPIHVGCAPTQQSTNKCCFGVCSHKFSLLVDDAVTLAKALSPFRFDVGQFHISHEGSRYMCKIDAHPRRRRA